MGFNSAFKGLKSDNNNGTVHADRYTVLIVSLSVLLRMRNVSDKSCRENQNTHFVLIYFWKSCRLSDNVGKTVKPDRPQMKIRRMRITGWIPKATDIHLGFVILISFPLRQHLTVTFYIHWLYCCFLYRFRKFRAEFCRAGHKYNCICCQYIWKNGKMITYRSESTVVTTYTTCSNIKYLCILPVLWFCVFPFNKQQLHLFC